MPPSASPGCAPRAGRCAPPRRRHRRTWSRLLVGGREQLPSVILELADGFLDVGQRLVFALLAEARDDARGPAARQFLERAHVEIAIVEEFLERRHVTREEAAIL